MSDRQVLNYGVALFPNFQYLDVAGPVDFLNTHSYDAIKNLTIVPKSVIDKAPTIHWHYISSNLDPVIATTGAAHLPTCTYDTCPALDGLVVPGGDPFSPAPKEFIKFVQERFVDPKLRALLLICTGSIFVAQSGILDGRHICSAKTGLLELSNAGVLNRKVKWVGDKRWTVDGKIWSSAAITAGLDLAAEFARIHFDEDLVKLALELSEYTPNPAQPDPFVGILEGVEL